MIVTGMLGRGALDDSDSSDSDKEQKENKAEDGLVMRSLG
jgi:hypothetical protein